MTEYDYSPAAYERYTTTQSRVSNWVSSQSSHTKSYSNPFVPSAYQPPQPLPPDDTRPSTKASSRSRSSTVTSNAAPSRQAPVRSNTIHHDVRGRSEAERRHTPTRSRTLPANAIVAPQPTYPVIPFSPQPVVPPPAHDHHQHHRSSHRSSTKSPTRSHHRHHHPPNNHSYAVAMPDRDPSGRTVIQLQRDSGHKVLHMPPPRLGEQYVIIPPPGGKVEVMSPQQYQTDGKDRERETTFLKRLFGGLTKGGGDSGHSSPSRSRARSRSESNGRRRRSY